MTKYNTGNPVGSADPRDLHDNAQVFDEQVNNVSSPTVVDRLGRVRTTLASQLGYNFKGDYAAGIELSSYNDIIRYSGEFYGPAASATLPYTTTATLPDADSNLVSRGDLVLRQDLAGEPTDGKGAALVNGATVFVGSVAEGFSGRSVQDGAQYQVADFYEGGNAKLSPEGAGKFVAKSELPKSNHDGIFVISPTVPPVSAQAGASLAERVRNFLLGTGETDPPGNGCFVRTDSADSKVPAAWGGASRDSGFDNSLLVIPLITAAKGRSVVYGAGKYEFYTQINISDSEFRDYGIEGVQGRPVEGLFWEDMTVFVVKVPSGDWFIRDEVDAHFGARIKHICVYGEDEANLRNAFYFKDFRNFEFSQVVISSFDKPFDIGKDEAVGVSLAYYSVISEVFIARTLKGIRTYTALNGTGFEKIRIAGVTGTGESCFDLENFGHTWIKDSWIEGGDSAKIKGTDGNYLVISDNWLEAPNVDIITDNVRHTVMTRNECHRSASIFGIVDLSFAGSIFEFTSNRVRNRTDNEVHYIDITGNVDPASAGTFIGKRNTFLEQASVTPSPGASSWWFAGNDAGKYVIDGNSYESDSGNVTYRVTKYFSASSNSQFWNNLTVTAEPKSAWPDPIEPNMIGGSPVIMKNNIVLQSPDGTLYEVSVDNAGNLARTNVGSMVT